jgi:hypothetical protein
MTPILAVGLAFFFLWLVKVSPPARRVTLLVVSVCLICGIGLWPLYALPVARVNLNTTTIFSAKMAADLAAFPLHTVFNGVPHEPLSRNNGHQAMYEARHQIIFPTALRDRATTYILEQPNSIATVRQLMAATKAGDLLIIPRNLAEGLQPITADENWAIVRNPS